MVFFTIINKERATSSSNRKMISVDSDYTCTCDLKISFSKIANRKTLVFRISQQNIAKVFRRR